MSNIIKFPSQSEQDEKVFDTMKEFEYVSYDMDNIYIHWGKERGLRAEMNPALNKIIITINEEGNRAWIYIHDWDGTEFKYILEPEFCLLISDDVNQLVDVGVYRLYYVYIKYIMYLHTNKTINHDEKYIEYVKNRYKEKCETEEYFIENKDFILDVINSPLIEEFD